MESLVILLLIEFAVLLLFGLGVWGLWRLVRRHFGGASGGWAGLAAAYGVAEGPRAPIATGATLVIGRVLWRNCITVGVEPAGLRLAVKVPLFGASGKAPLTIPWTAFHTPEPAKLYWRDATLWHLGTPEVGTITLPADLEAAIRAKGGFVAA